MLKKLIQSQYFNPGPLGIIVNPFYIARRSLYLGIREMGSSVTGKTLDVGCATKPYENLFRSEIYHGLEIESTVHSEESKADFYYDGNVFPFRDGEYDSVVTNQVLEHVFNPDQFLSEINRVLKQGGNLLLTVPFVWDEHEQPYDYARYSSFGLKSLLEKHGFEILRLHKTVPDLRVLFQLLNGYLYKVSASKGFLIKQIVQYLLIFPLSVLSFIALILPRNPDFFLDQVVLARKR